MIIYIIKNIINDKLYIGQTRQNLNKRIYRHKYNAFKLKKTTPLYNSFRKNGFDNFLVSSIELNNIDELDELEEFLIEELKTRDKIYGYNLCVGGKSRRGYNHSSETKKIIGEKSKGNKYALGKKLSEDHRKNISKGNIGRVHSDDTRKKISNGILKHYLNPENRRKVSLRTLGEGNSRAIFTDEFIYNLKKEFKETNVSKKNIAEKYNMKYSTCANILNGYKWGHIKI